MRRPLDVLALVLLLGIGAAKADVQPLPYGFGGTVTASAPNPQTATGAGPVQVLKANDGRKMFCVSNHSASDAITFGTGFTPTATAGFPVAANTFACMGGALIFQGVVQCYMPNAGDVCDAIEFY